MRWIKNLVINLAIFSLVLIITSNIIVNNLTQKNFPSIHNKIIYSRVHALIAPDLRNSTNINHNILFVGDSFTQGSGDSFLKGDYNYSVAHRAASDTINVVNTGFGGVGSLYSVVNAIEMKNVSKSSVFLEDFPKISKVIFFFYEGNDLNDNIGSLKTYNGFDNVINRLNQAEDMPFHREVYHGYFYGLNFIRYNKKIFKVYIKEFIGEENYNFLKSLFGRNIDNIHKKIDKPNLVKYKNNNFLVRELQGPAMELTDEQLNLSISIFKKSLEHLKSNFPNSELEVVYIPSVATIVGKYIDNKIKTQSYQSGGNLFVYDEIRNKSSFIKEKIKNTSLMLDIGFTDTTQFLIQDMDKSFLYGPIDMKHLNRDGYDSLYKSLSLNKIYE